MAASARSAFLLRIATIGGLLMLSSCDSAEAPGTGNDMSPAARQSELREAAEANAAMLAQDEELANQAAAAEAADTGLYGGNAAADEFGNGP